RGAGRRGGVDTGGEMSKDAGKDLSRREFFSFFRRPAQEPVPGPPPPVQAVVAEPQGRMQLAWAVVDWERCVTYKDEPCDLCGRGGAALPRPPLQRGHGVLTWRGQQAWWRQASSRP